MIPAQASVIRAVFAQAHEGSDRQAASQFRDWLKAAELPDVQSMIIELADLPPPFVCRLVRDVFTFTSKQDLELAAHFHVELIDGLLMKESSPEMCFNLAKCTSRVATVLRHKDFATWRSHLQNRALALVERALQQLPTWTSGPLSLSEFYLRSEAEVERANLLFLLSMTFKSIGRVDLYSQLRTSCLKSIRATQRGVASVPSSARSAVPYPERCLELFRVTVAAMELEQRCSFASRQALMTSSRTFLESKMTESATALIRTTFGLDKTTSLGKVAREICTLESADSKKAAWTLADLLRVRAGYHSQLGQYRPAVQALKQALHCIKAASGNTYSSTAKLKWLAVLGELAYAQQHLSLSKAVYIASAVKRESRWVPDWGAAHASIEKAEQVLKRRARVLRLVSVDAPHRKRRMRPPRFVRGMQVEVLDEEGSLLNVDDLKDLTGLERSKLLVLGRIRLLAEEIDRDHFGIHLTLMFLGDHVESCSGDSEVAVALPRIRPLVLTFVRRHMADSLGKLEGAWPRGAKDLRACLYRSAALIAGSFAPADALLPMHRLVQLHQERGDEHSCLLARITHFEQCVRVQDFLWGAKSALRIGQLYRARGESQLVANYALVGLLRIRRGLDHLLAQDDLEGYMRSAREVQQQLLALALSQKECLAPEALFAEVDATQARLFDRSLNLVENSPLFDIDVLLSDPGTVGDRRAGLLDAAARLQLGGQVGDTEIGSGLIAYSHKTEGLLRDLRQVARSWVCKRQLFVRFYWDGTSLWALPLQTDENEPLPRYVCRDPIRLSCTVDSIAQRARACRHQLNLGLESYDLRASLEELHAWLIDPLKGLLEDRRLVIITSEEIRGVPFHAIRGTDRFLIEDRPVSYVPSIAGLTEYAFPEEDVPSLVVGVDASLDAQREVRSIGMHLEAAGFKSNQVVDESGAFESLQSPDDYRIVYIAGHGFVSVDAKTSYLQIGNELITHRDWKAYGPCGWLTVFNVCHVADDSAVMPGEYEGFVTAALSKRGGQFCVAADRAISSDHAISFGESLILGIAAGEDPVLAGANAMRQAIACDRDKVAAWARYFIYGVS